MAGLYRGWLPPLWGSSVYRSLQFAVFEALYTKWGGPAGSPKSAPVDPNFWGRREIPYTGGIQMRVVAGGFVAATARAVMESPVEYAKVRRQVRFSMLTSDFS